MQEDRCYADPTLGLRELYNKLQAGPGTRVIEPAAAQLGKLGATLAGSGERIQSALHGTGATWQGQAATATTTALLRAGEWAHKGGEATHAGQGGVTDYADSYAALKAKVAAPVPVPDLSFFGRIADTFGPMSDHRKAIKQNTENAIAAYQALAEHERRASAALAAFPDVDNPPPVTNPAARTPDSGPPGRAAARPGGPGHSRRHATTSNSPPGPAYPGPEAASPTHTANQQQTPLAPSQTSNPPSPTHTPAPPPAPMTPPAVIATPPGWAPTGGPPGTRAPARAQPGTPGRAPSAGGGLSPWGEAPLRPRGVGTPGEPAGRPGPGWGTAPAAPAHPATRGLPGMPPPGLSGHGVDHRDQRHNPTVAPSDELFNLPLDNDVVSPVISVEDLEQ